VFCAGAGAALLLVPFLALALRWTSYSETPPVRFFDEMAAPPKYRAQSEGPFFADRRASQPDPPGAVARGELEAADAFFRGRAGEQYVTEFPLPVTAALMKRGQERYQIFCASCHGLAGAGDGMTAQRAEALHEGTWVRPATLYGEPVRKLPVGQLFETVTSGVRKMPAHGALIPAEDRWAIVLYVRALQRSQNPRREDRP
jgi:mono/diheme cytochrome c family protein